MQLPRVAGVDVRIRLLLGAQNARGAYPAGTVVDWPEATARPLVDVGAAELVPDPVPEKRPPRRARRVEGEG